jgi:hypothetical protein
MPGGGSVVRPVTPTLRRPHLAARSPLSDGFEIFLAGVGERDGSLFLRAFQKTIVRYVFNAGIVECWHASLR